MAGAVVGGAFVGSAGAVVAGAVGGSVVAVEVGGAAVGWGGRVFVGSGVGEAASAVGDDERVGVIDANSGEAAELATSVGTVSVVGGGEVGATLLQADEANRRIKRMVLREVSCFLDCRDIFGVELDD